MPIIARLLLFSIFIFSLPALAQTTKDAETNQVINELTEPLYNPFVERYVLDEIKQLRIDLATNKNDLQKQILDREHNSVDRGVRYATDTITYFFYLIAAASSVLVLIGWTSIRDIKDRVHTVAEEQISDLIGVYEQRLASIEKQLQQKTRHIEQNRGEIELTQELQSLWLRAQQEISPHSRIEIYDQIIKLHNNDIEALTYKADTVLELNEPQWAVNLCHQALKIDPENSHAFYQLACAYSSLHQVDEALNYLAKAIGKTESFRQQLAQDPALEPLHDVKAFQALLKTPT